MTDLDRACSDARDPIAVLVPISVGELIDKISILRIKRSKITHDGKLTNVAKELEALEAVLAALGLQPEIVDESLRRLGELNGALWQLEDDLRAYERLGRFDQSFIDKARQVYLMNDERADLKRKINMLTNSFIIEEKSFS